MRTRPFGPTGIDVPLIGQGTWQVNDHDAAIGALQTGMKLGMTHIDTAELYTGSEDSVGRAIRGRRDDVFLVSKVLPHHASHAGTLAACAASLDRLGVESIDVYLLHWRGEHPLEETFRAMGELVDDGHIRAFGVSNFDVEDLEEALGIVGPGKIACNQVRYHMNERGIEHELIPWCQQHDVAVVGYSPYGSGRFPRANSEGGMALGSVAAQIGATPRQVALAFLTRLDGTFTIPKAEHVEHVPENAGGDLRLPKDAIEELDAAFPTHGVRTP